MVTLSHLVLLSSETRIRELWLELQNVELLLKKISEDKFITQDIGLIQQLRAYDELIYLENRS